MTNYGYLLRLLHCTASQRMNNALAAMELTSAQGKIMGFLACRKEPPCPKDIEEEFHLTHPTVSGLLSRLEKKDFIQLMRDENDRRVKRIHIRPKGKDCLSAIYAVICEAEENLVLGFSEEEKVLFRQLLIRAAQNMGAECCCNKEDNS